MLGVRSQVAPRPAFEPSLVSGPLCRINWANPITRGLRFAFNGADWVDLVTGTVATQSGSPYRTVKFGVPCTRFDGATSDYLDFLGTGNLWNLTGPISVLWRGSFDAVAGGIYRNLAAKQVSGSNIPIDSYLHNTSGSASYVRGNESGTSTQKMSSAPPTSQLINLLFADDANPATSGVAYQDAVDQSITQVTTGATSATSTPGSMRIGRRHDGLTQLTGYVANVLIWDRILTRAEYFSLLADLVQIYDYGGVNRLALAGIVSTGSYSDSISEALTSTDAAAALEAFLAVSADSATLSDAQTSLAGFSADDAESLTAADAQDYAGAAAAAAAESVTLTDQSAAGAAFASAIAESGTLTDFGSAVAAFQAALAESITATDVQAAAAAFLAAAADTFTAADASDWLSGQFGSTAESATLTDAIQALAVFSAASAESVTASDVDAVVAAFVAGIVDSLAAVDVQTGTTTGALSLTQADIDAIASAVWQYVARSLTVSVDANVVSLNGAQVIGTGTQGDDWRGVGVMP